MRPVEVRTGSFREQSNVDWQRVQFIGFINIDISIKK